MASRDPIASGRSAGDCGPAAGDLRWPRPTNASKHGRNGPRRSPVRSGVFARVCWASRFSKVIGANGSDRLSYAVFGLLRSLCAVPNQGSSRQRRLHGPQVAVLCGPASMPRPGCVGAQLRCACQSEGPVDRGGSPAVVAARRRGSTRLLGKGKVPYGLVVQRSGRGSRGSRHRVVARRRLGRAPTLVGLDSGTVGRVVRASPESRGRRSPPPRSSSAIGRGACRGWAASRSPRARDTTRPMRFAHRLRGRSPRPSRRAASAHLRAA
jgi:hypothetical protein